MAYTGEVLRRAKLRLEQAKSDREAENAQHLRQAYAKVPRLAEIDRELRLTMVRAAQTVFQEGLDVQAEFQRIRQENQSLQQERQWLIEDNFEEGYLDDSPICPHCGGSGYVGSMMCECLRELCRQEQRKELTVLTGAAQETFSSFRLEYYPERFDPNLGASPREIMALTFATCRKYAQSFSLKSGNLLLNGNPGLGKTFLSACIARSVSDSGYSVVYETAARLFGQLEKARFTGDAEAQSQAARFTACELLIIDDLGTEMASSFVTASLYSLINDRILSGKPTIISTNLNAQEIADRYSPQIASRLRGNYRQLTFVGEDIRLKRR